VGIKIMQAELRVTESKGTYRLICGYCGCILSSGLSAASLSCNLDNCVRCGAKLISIKDIVNRYSKLGDLNDGKEI
jgi:hypothetical protein